MAETRPRSTAGMDGCRLFCRRIRSAQKCKAFRASRRTGRRLDSNWDREKTPALANKLGFDAEDGVRCCKACRQACRWLARGKTTEPVAGSAAGNMATGTGKLGLSAARLMPARMAAGCSGIAGWRGRKDARATLG